MSLPDLTTSETLLSQDDWAQHLRDDTIAGLKQDPPNTPPVWFYDETGSKLFDEITFLPEYYPSAAERQILRDRSSEIAERSDAEVLVEIGAGSAEKTMRLLTGMSEHGTLRQYVPMDCSESALENAARAAHEQFPELAVHYVVADFNAHLHDLPHDGRRMLAFLGSTLGNLTVAQRAEFLAEVTRSLGDEDTFLVGTDLVKDTDRLVRAYDDAEGVTAAFNRNALAVMNAELGADFDDDAFRHEAIWNDDEKRIEMRLVADSAQSVTFSKLGDLHIDLDAGDFLRTEMSHKFTPEVVDAELQSAGMVVVDRWFDDNRDYMLTLAKLA